MSETKPLPFEPDPVIEAYKRDVDRTLLRENLKLTPAERVEKMIAVSRPAWRSARQRDLRGIARAQRDPRRLGISCRFVDLETLIHLKRGAGRPKDFERIAELEALLEERSRRA